MKLYNTKSKKLEEFKSINHYEVLLYTCGPTVYDYLHIGNWVAYVRWDILVRTLINDGYDVKRVMNITDVGHLVSDADDGEDKMEKGAKREGKTAWDVAHYYTNYFLEGMVKLNLKKPKYITKATDFIKEQIELVKILEEKGYTYKISDGIYFDTAKFPKYAEFANLNLDDIKKGARVEFNPEKRNPSDFAVWKFSSEGHTRDMEWDSPWGIGFPGWHLGCSAMAMDKLGPTIDIHTGGIDHIPVHHTNEIAQSEAATGQTFANYWIHNNFLLVNGTKISKSLGNIITLEILEAKGYSADDFRLFVLQSHYRTESNFSWDNLAAAQNRLKRWRGLSSLLYQTELFNDRDGDENGLKIFESIDKIKECLNNDLDTPGALAVIENSLDLAEKYGINDNEENYFSEFIDAINELLGLDIDTKDISSENKSLLEQRKIARAQTNWQLSDSIRDTLASQGIRINDSKYGQIWHKET
jgi:cysteinyl-tRNA synthetase